MSREAFDLLLLVACICAAVAAYVIPKFRSSGRMTAADVNSYEGSINRAALELAELKREHDETGEHTWLDVSSYSEPNTVICQFCSARRVDTKLSPERLAQLVGDLERLYRDAESCGRIQQLDVQEGARGVRIQ